jgi:hypothetical protein
LVYTTKTNISSEINMVDVSVNGEPISDAERANLYLTEIAKSALKDVRVTE